MMLVTLEEAKYHLRIDDSSGADDLDLELKIRGASAAVLRYIDAEQPFLDSSGAPIDDSSGASLLPDDIRIATLLLIGDFYKEREGESNANWEYGFLPRSVLSLLYPYRTPVSA